MLLIFGGSFKLIFYDMKIYIIFMIFINDFSILVKKVVLVWKIIIL